MMTAEQALQFLAKLANDYSKTLDRSAEEAVIQMANHCFSVLNERMRQTSQNTTQGRE